MADNDGCPKRANFILWQDEKGQRCYGHYGSCPPAQIAIDRDTVSRPMTRGLRTISIITAISGAAQDVDSGPARSDAKGVARADVSVTSCAGMRRRMVSMKSAPEQCIGMTTSGLSASSSVPSARYNPVAR